MSWTAIAILWHEMATLVLCLKPSHFFVLQRIVSKQNDDNISGGFIWLFPCSEIYFSKTQTNFILEFNSIVSFVDSRSWCFQMEQRECRMYVPIEYMKTNPESFSIPTSKFCGQIPVIVYAPARPSQFSLTSEYHSPGRIGWQCFLEVFVGNLTLFMCEKLEQRQGLISSFHWLDLSITVKASYHKRKEKKI